MRLLLVLPCVSGFFVGLRPAPAPSARCLAHMRGDPEATRDSEGSYEAYVADRASGKSQYGSIEDAAADFAEFEKYNLDFDGGDSGGGVVGDGNTDLEDQHNSASIVRPKPTNPGPRPNPNPIPNPNPNRYPDARPKPGPRPNPNAHPRPNLANLTPAVTLTPTLAHTPPLASRDPRRL